MPSLGVLFPSNLFRVARSTTHALAPQLWRDNAIPSFSSLAIESQLPNIKTTADALVYLNDDFFTLKKVATSDLHSLLFGPMLRFGMNQYMQSRKYGSSGASKEGEVRSSYPEDEHRLRWTIVAGPRAHKLAAECVVLPSE